MSGPEPAKLGGLTGKISKVEIDGSFQVDWSDEILQVYKASVVEKNVVQVSVIWLNDAIRSGLIDKPKYTSKIIDINERSISF